MAADTCKGETLHEDAETQKCAEGNDERQYLSLAKQ